MAAVLASGRTEGFASSRDLPDDTANITQQFKQKARSLIKDPEEQDALYLALNEYQGHQNLVHFLESLRTVLNTPSRLELFHAIKPLVSLPHQLQYDVLAPQRPSSKGRVINLWRRPGDNWGFCIRGGFEYNTGIFVSSVSVDSQAYARGLRAGDELLQIQGLTVTHCLTEEVERVLRSLPEVELRVRRIGLLPSKESSRSHIQWRYVDDLDKIIEERGRPVDGQTVRIFINLGLAGGSLGCSICSGPRSLPGIFVQGVREDGLAHEAGLEVGDQLLSVNGTSLLSATHSQAVVALKSSRNLHVTIRKGMGRGLFGEASVEWSAEQKRDREKAEKLRSVAMQITTSHVTTSQITTSQLPPKQEEEEEDERLLAEEAEEKARAREEEFRLLEEKTTARFAAAAATTNGQVQQTTTTAAVIEPEPRSTSYEDEEFRRRQEELREEGQRAQLELRLSREREAEERRQQASVAPLQKLMENGGADSESEMPDSEVGEKEFTPEEIDERELVVATFDKAAANDFAVEAGGEGQVVISDVFYKGLIHQHGKMGVGDQVMKVGTKKLTNVTAEEAQKAIQHTAAAGRKFRMVVAKPAAKDYEDEVTYL